MLWITLLDGVYCGDGCKITGQLQASFALTGSHVAPGAAFTPDAFVRRALDFAQKHGPAVNPPGFNYGGPILPENEAAAEEMLAAARLAHRDEAGYQVKWHPKFGMLGPNAEFYATEINRHLYLV